MELEDTPPCYYSLPYQLTFILHPQNSVHKNGSKEQNHLRKTQPLSIPRAEVFICLTISS